MNPTRNVLISTGEWLAARVFLGNFFDKRLLKIPLKSDLDLPGTSLRIRQGTQGSSGCEVPAPISALVSGGSLATFGL